MHVGSQDATPEHSRRSSRYGDAMREPPADVRAGDVLDDRYRLTSLVGTGGMGRVYRADDLLLGRAVAVKVVHTAAADAPLDDRVRSETTLLASLSHPALVTLYDARLSGEGARYLVMELLDGPTLADRIDGGPLPPDELAAVAENLAEALHIVHEAGIVHRDIKPSNILLAASPIPGIPLRAKLADFGIAHLLDSARITQPGLAVGTVGYLAPEQVRGAAPAPASDVYSLGLVLREAATATRAFAPALGNEQLFARLNADPDLPSSLTPRWRDLLARMLSRDPGERPSALDVLLALRAGAGADTDAAAAAVAASLPAAPAREVTPVAPRPVTTTGEPTASWPVQSLAAAVAMTPVAPVSVATPEPQPAAPSLVADVASRRALRARPRPRRSRRATPALWGGAAAVVIAGSLVAWGAVGGAPSVASDPSPGASLPAAEPSEVAEPANEAEKEEGAVTVSDGTDDVDLPGSTPQPQPDDAPTDRGKPGPGNNNGNRNGNAGPSNNNGKGNGNAGPGNNNGKGNGR